MRIEFTADTNPELQGGDFKKGAFLDCSPASGHHWIRRGVAVEVAAKPAPTLKAGRPMMGDTKKFRDEMAKVDLGVVAAVVDADTPKKRGRPKKGA